MSRTRCRSLLAIDRMYVYHVYDQRSELEVVYKILVPGQKGPSSYIYSSIMYTLR